LVGSSCGVGQPIPGAEVKHEGEVLGAVLRTQDKVKPVFVSVGHRTDLPAAISLVLRLCSRYRLPDPARRAHQLTRELRRRKK
ncbi:MAG TPA: endonuclease V, partial [Candidatus Deferrimicrobiaceae bacterium]|nr:endonuclease V [Candidatus Deferrimicrobiaceae bacterium]